MMMNDDATIDEDTIDEATNTGTAEADDTDTDDSKRYDGKYVKKLRDEAAQYRRQATSLESEVAELRDYRLNRVVGDATAGVLRDPNDLSVYGRLDECFDQDGKLDPERVAEAAKALRKERPYLGVRHGDGDQGARGKSVGGESHVAALSDLLRGAAKS